MPLSEHEQRLLDQMERALYAEDPSFATQLRATGQPRGGRARAALGVVGVLAGLALVLAGVATELIVLGILGFAGMLVGAVVAVGAFRAGATAEAAPVQERPAGESAGFMDRMEDRWRRRLDPGADD